MTAIELGSQPAFPAYAAGKPGLTKREHFASLAMQGLVSRDYSSIDYHTRVAVEIADALLARLAEQQP